MSLWEAPQPEIEVNEDVVTEENSTAGPASASDANGEKAVKKAVKKASKKAGTKKASGNGAQKAAKKAPAKKTAVAAKADTGSRKAKKAAGKRPFPQNTLEEALAIPQAIKENNNGRPFETAQVALACRISPKGNPFFYIAGSSRDYGLTKGSRATPTIELTELGRSIVYPLSPESQRQAKLDAFLSVPLFKQVYEHYSGGKLPAKEFVSSLLFTQFGLAESLHDDFCDLYEKNRIYVGAAGGSNGAPKFQKREAEGDEPILLSQSGQYAQHVFVIMPFSEKGDQPRPPLFFEEVLKSLVTPACNSVDFGVDTARMLGSDVIHHTIIRHLEEADLVLADLTDHNPNVLFELGIRIALDKPVLLIRASGTKPIFDVDHLMRVCEYDDRLWKTTIEKDIKTLSEYVKGAWEHRDSPSYMKILKTGH